MKHKILILSLIIAISGVFLGFLAAPTSSLALSLGPQTVGSTLGLSIDSEGNVKIEGASVLQKAGSTIFARQDWPVANLRFTIVTSNETVVTRRFGGKTTVAEVLPGHFIGVTGKFIANSDAIMVKAKTIKNWSLQNEAGNFSGVITEVSADENQITLKTDSGSVVLVKIESSQITKGKIVLGTGDLKIGDRVLSVIGSYDIPRNTLSAEKIEIYQTKEIFAPRNFQGTLKEFSGTELPVTLTVLAEGKIYQVYVPSGASIWNTARQNVSLLRFLKNDTVRFYGSIRETNLSEVDAKIIRDINL